MRDMLMVMPLALEQIRVVVAGVLRAAVGMMDEPGFDDAAHQGHARRGQRQFIFCPASIISSHRAMVVDAASGAAR